MTNDEISREFLAGLRGVLNNWRVWLGDDELRAVHVGFDSYNTEIAINLLTDREPYLDARRANPFGEKWPTADWRLTCVNQTFRHDFPDAAALLGWMSEQARALDGDDVRKLNASLKELFFAAATSDLIRADLKKFRRVSKPLRIRIEGWFDEDVRDAELTI